MPGSSTHPSMLADAVTSAVNLQPAVSMCSPGAVRVEMEIIRWICTEVIGYDAKGPSGGVLTSGGSSANMYAVATARDSVNLRARDYEKSVVYVSTEVHHCFVKALRACGMRDCVVRRIAVDSCYKMTAELLAEAIESDKKSGLRPLMVIATAGTTGTGTIDPLSQIADIAEREKLWFHVDAAYGGFFSLASDDLKSLFDGWQMADSVTLDPHKSLFVPFGTGAFLVKNVKHLIDMYAADDVKYMPPRQGDYYDKLDPNMLCPEMSRGFRGLRVWLPLKVFGLGPVRAALQEKVMLCRYFYQEIQLLTDFEVGPYPEISICLFRYSPKLTNGYSQAILDELNKRLLESINREGIIFLTSYADSNGNSGRRFWLRLAVMNFKSHLCDVRQAIKTIRSKAERILEHACDISVINNKLNNNFKRAPLCRFNSTSY